MIRAVRSTTSAPVLSEAEPIFEVGDHSVALIAGAGNLGPTAAIPKRTGASALLLTDSAALDRQTHLVAAKKSEVAATKSHHYEHFFRDVLRILAVFMGRL